MIYLLTRPIVLLIAVVMMIVKAPFKAVARRRNHRARKDAKFAAEAIREQQRAAKSAAS